MDPLFDAQKNFLKKCLFVSAGTIIVFFLLSPLLAYVDSLLIGTIPLLLKEITITNIQYLLLYVCVLLVNLYLLALPVIWTIRFAAFYKEFKNISFIFEDTSNLTFIKAKHFVLNQHLAGFMLTDTEKRKWCYMLPALTPLPRLPGAVIKKIKKKLVQKNLKVTYYSGTNLIRELPLNLYDL